jgi:Uma2 family endonuclease
MIGAITRSVNLVPEALSEDLSVSIQTLSPPADSTPPELHRLDLQTYHEMIRQGLLKSSDRVVLLDGLIVKKMPKGPKHVATTMRIYSHLDRSLPPGWHVRKEDPVMLPRGPDGDSEPEPDVTVVRGPPADYEDRHPGPDDIVAIIEVADSSLANDRYALRRFAWAGIPTVWIVNLRSQNVEIYTQPSGGGDPPYRDSVVHGAGDEISIKEADGRLLVTMRLDEIVKPRV